MNRFALIKNGVCTNVVVWDSQQEYPLEEGEYLLQHETASPGWVLQDNQLVDPNPVIVLPPEPEANQPTVTGAQTL